MVCSLNSEASVVLDACVLAPMPLCDTLLRCAEEYALFRPLWSAETLVEVRRDLKKFGCSASQNRVIANLRPIRLGIRNPGLLFMSKHSASPKRYKRYKHYISFFPKSPETCK